MSISIYCPATNADGDWCEAPIELDVRVIGRYWPGTRWEPPEWPEVELASPIPTTCGTCGAVYTADERRAMQAEAERALEDYDTTDDGPEWDA